MFGFLDDTTIRASDEKGLTLALSEPENQNFYIYTDIIKSQYHGDVVVTLLRTVTVKGKHGTYLILYGCINSSCEKFFTLKHFSSCFFRDESKTLSTSCSSAEFAFRLLTTDSIFTSIFK